MSSEPEMPRKGPYVEDLAPGTYWWCACGRSASQPFCDGSHQGSGIEPVEFRVEQPGKQWLCGCKRTASPPYCDGTHDKL